MSYQIKSISKESEESYIVEKSDLKWLWESATNWANTSEHLGQLTFSSLGYKKGKEEKRIKQTLASIGYCWTYRHNCNEVHRTRGLGWK